MTDKINTTGAIQRELTLRMYSHILKGLFSDMNFLAQDVASETGDSTLLQYVQDMKGGNSSVVEYLDLKSSLKPPFIIAECDTSGFIVDFYNLPPDMNMNSEMKLSTLLDSVHDDYSVVYEAELPSGNTQFVFVPVGSTQSE